MDAAQILDFLSREYGISSREELFEEASAIPGVNLGIFTFPLCCGNCGDAGDSGPRA